MVTRRNFLLGASAAGVALSAATVSSVAMAALPQIVSMETPDTQPPLTPENGRPYNPVVTLNGWTLPWRMNNGVKEFHLVAEPVVREMAPGMKAHLWGGALNNQLQHLGEVKVLRWRNQKSITRS
jgi:hypothetical protein